MNDCLSVIPPLSFDSLSSLFMTSNLEVAQEFALSSRQANPFCKAVDHSTHTPMEKPKSRGGIQDSISRSSSKLSTLLDQEKLSKPERNWLKERARDRYSAWCAVKTAQETLTAQYHLELLTAELHNEDIVKDLSAEATASLPDFARSHLCQPTMVVNTLATNLELMPASMLSPSSQATSTTNLTWLKVVGYTKSLLQKCFWERSTDWCPLAWALHYHCLTPVCEARAQAMVTFLQQYFAPFNATCKLPSTSALFSTSLAPGQLPIAGSTPRPAPAMHAKDCGHLVVTNNELTVMWFEPYLPVSKHHDVSADSKMSSSYTGHFDKEEYFSFTESTYTSDLAILTGLFAFNNKALTSHPPSNLTNCGVDVAVVRISEAVLFQLRKEWEELQAVTKVYLDARAIPRPLSRSPSKQRKSEKAAQKIPTELQVSY